VFSVLCVCVCIFMLSFVLIAAFDCERNYILSNIAELLVLNFTFRRCWNPKPSKKSYNLESERQSYGENLCLVMPSVLSMTASVSLVIIF